MKRVFAHEKSSIVVLEGERKYSLTVFISCQSLLCTITCSKYLLHSQFFLEMLNWFVFAKGRTLYDVKFHCIFNKLPRFLLKRSEIGNWKKDSDLDWPTSGCTEIGCGALYRALRLIGWVYWPMARLGCTTLSRYNAPDPQNVNLYAGKVRIFEIFSEISSEKR